MIAITMSLSNFCALVLGGHYFCALVLYWNLCILY
jgi:hypothetical protein